MSYIHNAWLKKYNELNNSFKKQLIFRIGADSGFFSEYNHMIFAMLYCLKNQIQFVLSSKDNNFSIDKGWQDFFLPFSKESKSKLHAKYNMRGPAPRTTATNIKSAIFRRALGADFFTQHLWENFRTQERLQDVVVPELNLGNSLVDNCHVIVNNIWAYQPDIATAVVKKINALNLPDEYVGIHVRSGDKITEHKLYQPADYILKSLEHSSCTNFYIATDDYKNVRILKTEFPDYKFYTSCPTTAEGYLHSKFAAQSNETKKAALIELFVDVDILSNAKIFIGTYSSNIGMYIGMRRDVSTCYCLDFDEWRIW